MLIYPHLNVFYFVQTQPYQEHLQIILQEYANQFVHQHHSTFRQIVQAPV